IKHAPYFVKLMRNSAASSRVRGLKSTSTAGWSLRDLVRNPGVAQPRSICRRGFQPTDTVPAPCLQKPASRHIPAYTRSQEGDSMTCQCERSRFVRSLEEEYFNFPEIVAELGTTQKSMLG